VVVLVVQLQETLLVLVNLDYHLAAVCMVLEELLPLKLVNMAAVVAILH
jgi:hypothetical protein